MSGALATKAGALLAEPAPAINPRLLDIEAGPWREPLLNLAQALASTVAARDRQGGSAQAQKQLIRDSGLLRLSIPQQLGGAEAGWPQIFRFTRYLAAVDSSLAHLFAFHHLQVATILLFGNERQRNHWLTQTLEQNWFWGNATNGRDTGLRLTQLEEHYQLVGSKSFCSGALGADALVVSVPRHRSRPDDRVFLVVPAERDGLLINDDWDGFGQRQTDSGTVNFGGVFVDAGDLLEHGAGTLRSTLRTCVSQLVLVQIYLGNALGALNAAMSYLDERAQGSLGVAPDPVDEGFTHLRLGDLWARLQAASALTDQAGEALQRAWQSDEPSARERGELATRIAEAKLLSARVALDVTSQVFESMGARATSSRYGFDRFWRNVRVHTLHDALDHKQRDIGRWLLSGEHPVPSIYS